MKEKGGYGGYRYYIISRRILYENEKNGGRKNHYLIIDSFIIVIHTFYVFQNTIHNP